MSEHDEQAALFEWAAWQSNITPELKMLYAIPNGGHRHKAVAAKMKAEGVKAGVLDIHLPVARNGFIGLWIEMKFANNKPSDKQSWWIENLRNQGHFVRVCWNSSEAQATIEEYLGL
jgi:hypothetical protein